MPNEKSAPLKDIQEQEKQSLLHNLSLPPEQRIINHQKALNLFQTLKEAKELLDAKRS
ncbi:MAG TPA: hypothetical protein VNJ08_03120 [Bacteriovoracaceae bacterium]|nr:hypothetical protein [Bacteriovoracaceae bacterium]